MQSHFFTFFSFAEFLDLCFCYCESALWRESAMTPQWGCLHSRLGRESTHYEAQRQGGTKEQPGEQCWIRSRGSYTVNTAIVRLRNTKEVQTLTRVICTDMHRQPSGMEIQTHSSHSPCCHQVLAKEERDWFSLSESVREKEKLISEFYKKSTKTSNTEQNDTNI